ncbi:MAG TPA: ABC transporter permease [Phycisphaerae bacterium]|nr:ABC transporter permease [Phycisphaerales bacterium]HNO78495.1 ABC transporter permease [Phycisphaerae bacterium]
MNIISLEMLRLGMSSLRLHKLRTMLTALGIIFGVAAVICMLSISETASADEMRMIQLLGTQNIVVNSVKPEAEIQVSQGNQQMLAYGITYKDLEIIEKTVPHLDRVVPVKQVAYAVRYRDRQVETDVFGTTPEFFATVNTSAARGRVLSTTDEMESRSVCVIGADVGDLLFGIEDPLGQNLLVTTPSKTAPYTIVGVLDRVKTAGTPRKGVEERNINMDIFIPFTVASKQFGDITVRGSSVSREFKRVDLTTLYLAVDSTENVIAVSEVARRTFQLLHEKVDYEIVVPYRTLQLAEKKKQNSQYQLGSIAGISLLVGGIGIMNIMLATVTERTREIGVRRALGAKRLHITIQFLVETAVISMAGGLLGIILGYAGAYAIAHIYAWGNPIVKFWSIGLSFGLSVMIGIFFGMYPAMKAAQLDPIEALRNQ